MRIYCENSGREARPIKGPKDTTPVFKCFLPGAKKNLDINAHKFDSVLEAADFIRSNRGAGIRVAGIGSGSGQQTAILNANLIVEHDDGRKERI